MHLPQPFCAMMSLRRVFFMRISLRATDDVGEGRVMLSFLATQQFQVTKVYQNSESQVGLNKKISFWVK